MCIKCKKLNWVLSKFYFVFLLVFICFIPNSLSADEYIDCPIITSESGYCKDTSVGAFIKAPAEIRVGKRPEGGTFRPILVFDTSSIPDNAVILDATIYVNCTEAVSGISAYVWDLDVPLLSGQNLYADAGSGTQYSYSWSICSNTGTSYRSLRSVGKDAVKASLSGNKFYCGIAARSGYEGNDYARFENSSQRLYLHVRYTTDCTDPPFKAHQPNPSNNSVDVALNTQLSWSDGGGATSYDVYFGTDPSPDSGEDKGNQTGTTYSPGTLDFDTTYYWRIDSKNDCGTTEGDVWSFTTEAEPACTYSINPIEMDFDAGSHSNNFNVTTQNDCTWTADSSDSWIHTISSGTGNGTVNFTIDENAGLARTGTISVEGQTFTINQAASNPDPSPDLISVVGIPDSITLGESFTITIQALNNGGTSPEGAINTSYTGNPTLSAVNAPDLNIVEKAPGEAIYDINGNSISATNRLLEVYETEWTESESHLLTVTVTPQETGDMYIYVRTTMQDNDTDSWFNDTSVTNGNGNYTDQQGWSARRFTVEVIPESPDPSPDLILVSGIPDSITLGESFTITIQATNNGGSSPEGAINTSYTGNPTLSNVNAPDLNIVEKAPGESIYDINGNSISATNRLLEVYETDWIASESHTLTVTVTPQETGDMYIYVRTTMQDNDTDTWFNDVSVTDGDGNYTDQQGWTARRFTVEVYSQNTLPNTPIPISPGDEEVVSTLTPTFEWSEFQHGGDGDTQEGYQLRVRDNGQIWDFPTETDWEYNSSAFTNLYSEWEDASQGMEIDGVFIPSKLNYRVINFQGRNCLQMKTEANTQIRQRPKLSTINSFKNGRYEWKIYIPSINEPWAQSSIGAFLYSPQSLHDGMNDREIDFEIGYGKEEDRVTIEGITDEQLLCFMTVQPDNRSSTPHSSTVIAIDAGHWYSFIISVGVNQLGKYVISWQIINENGDEIETREPFVCGYGTTDTSFNIFCSLEELEFIGKEKPNLDKEVFFEYVKINDIIVYDTGCRYSESSHDHIYAPGIYTGYDPISKNWRFSNPLRGGNQYHWHVRYLDSSGDWSEWSADDGPDSHQDFFTQISSQPEIYCTPDNLSPTCTEGHNADSQKFYIWNTGSETLNYTISSNENWIVCVPEEGGSAGETDSITINYQTESLNAGEYPATITISDPNASNNPQTISVLLTVNPPCISPNIETNPQSQTIVYNTSVDLSVEASGTEPLNFQWYQGNSGDTMTLVGTNASTYPTPNLLDTTSYWVRITNECGTIDSDTATITVVIPLPEINIKKGASNVADGGSCDFGSIEIGTNKDISFAVENTGTADLMLSDVVLSETDDDQFSVEQQPVSPVSSGGDTNFTIRFSPTSEGLKTATISIPNNDTDENPYEIILSGTGINENAEIYGFNEGIGTSFSDENEGGNTGTICNGAEWEVSGIKDNNGQSGSALKYDGINDFSRLEYHPITDGPFTLLLWAKKLGQGGGSSWVTVIRTSQPDTLAGYDIYWFNDNRIQYRVRTDTDSNVMLTYPDAVENEWTHIAISLDDSKARLFINGNMEAEEPITGNMNPPNWPFTIGGQGGGIDDAYFNGIIDGLKIYPVTLSSAEVANIYQQERPDDGYLFFDDFEDGNLDGWEILSDEVSVSTENKKNGSYSMKLYDNSSSTSPGIRLTLNTSSNRVGVEFYEWTNDFGWDGGTTYALETTTEQYSGWAFWFGAQYYTGGKWRYINIQDKSNFEGVNPWINSDNDLPTPVSQETSSWHKIKLELYGPEGKARFWYDDEYKGEVDIESINDPIKYFSHNIGWSSVTGATNYIDDIKFYELSPLSNPNILYLTPTLGPVGTEVTISGTNFGASPGTVTYDGLNASIISWTNAQIVSEVPTGVSIGLVAVLVHIDDGKQSNEETFSVCVIPVINTHPQSQSIPVDTNTSLSVDASDSGSLSYQWYKGDSGDTTTPVGDNSSSFPTPNLIETTSYWVRVSNDCGYVDSDTATITVYVPLPEIDIKYDTTSISDGGSYDFGIQEVCTIRDITFTVYNTGNSSLELTGIPIINISGTYADQFSIEQQPISPVAADGSTTFVIRFHPTSVGQKTASISIANNDSDENPYDISITGTGISPEINVKQGDSDIPDGGSYDFGIQEVCIYRDLTFTIENIGTSDLILSGSPIISISGANADQFSVEQEPVSPVATGGSSVFVIQFHPTSVGQKTVLISIANNDSDENPYDISITGTGISPEINVKQGDSDIPDGEKFDFGSYNVGTNTDVVFTIENIGTSDLILSGSPIIGIGGADADEFSVEQLPVSPVVPGGSTTFIIRFNPTSGGLKTASISIVNNNLDENPYDINITGTGVSPEINVKQGDSDIPDGGSYDFGIQEVCIYRDLTFTIENIGTSDLILSGSPIIGIGGADADEFSVEQLPVSPVVPGGSTTFIIRFNPTSGGLKTASISIANNDLDENPYDINITGTGVSPEINVKQGDFSLPDGGNYDFGEQEVGTQEDVAFTIENIGTSDLTLSGSPIISISGAKADQFSVQEQPSSTIAPDNSTTFVIRFSPTSGGLKTASISIANNDLDENPYDITLTGTGTEIPVPEIDIKYDTTSIPDGGSYDFDTQEVGTHKDIAFTIHNTGNSDLELTGTPIINISGADAEQFSVGQEPVSPVAAGESTTFVIRFHPISVGLKSASISIANSDADENPYDINITGTGVSPEINVKQGDSDIPDGGTFDFGIYDVGTNTDVVFTIENIGTSGLTLSGSPIISISGANADQFSIGQQPTSPIAPDNSTTFIIRFYPTSGGLKTASISIANNDLDENPYDIVLEGTGCLAAGIDTHPQSQTIHYNTSADLEVIASGTEPFDYQWYQGESGDTSTPVGTNASEYATPNLITTTSYWVKVSNACGSINSNTATITVMLLLIMTDEDEVSVSEGGSAELDVKLSAQPLSDLSIAVEKISGDEDITLAPDIYLLFTPDNWNIWQTIPFEAAEDNDCIDGEAVIQLRKASGEDEIGDKEIIVIERDNDFGAISLDFNPFTGTWGNIINILVEISDNCDEISAFGFELIYDSTVFEYKDVKEGKLTLDWIIGGNEIEPGKTIIGGYSGGGAAINPSSRGSIVEITLQVKCVEYDEETEIPIRIEKYTDDIAEYLPNPCESNFTFIPCPRLGDVSGEGEVTPGDAQKAFEIYLGILDPDLCQDASCDANCDGTTSPGDARDILDHYLGKIVLPVCCTGDIELVGPSSVRSVTGERWIIPDEPVIYPLDTISQTGMIVNVPIIISNPEGRRSFSFEVNYAPEALEFIGLKRSQLTDHFEYVRGLEEFEGVIRIEGKSHIPIAERQIGSLVVLEFILNKEMSGELPIYIFNPDDSLLNVEIGEGIVLGVDSYGDEGKQLSFGRAVFIPDGTVRIPVKASSAFNMKSFGIDFRYPEEKMIFIGIERADLTEDFILLEGNEPETGIVRVGGFRMSGIQQREPGVLFELVFFVREKGGLVEIIKLVDDLQDFIIREKIIEIK